jgi:molecular chaperone GrpE (heat shock protein)
MGANMTSPTADEYIDKDQMDAQFCVECKNSLEQQKEDTKAAEAERDKIQDDYDALEYKYKELDAELDNTKKQLTQCNSSKESFTSSGGSNTFLWIIIALIVGIILGMFIARRYSYIFDKRISELFSAKKEN